MIKFLYSITGGFIRAFMEISDVLKYKMDVLDVLKSRLGNTLLLGGTGFLIIFAGAMLLGVICACNEGG